MNRLSVLCAIGLLLALCGRSAPTCADEPQDENRRADASAALAEREADAYTFHLETADATPLKRFNEPVLRWSNPLVGSIHGSVYIWTAQGRPEVIASFYKWFHPFRHRANEMQSLSTERLVGERDNRTVWTTTRPGMELKPFAAAAKPAQAPAQRLRQMRELAKGFTGRITDRPTTEKPEPINRDLRLLTQPIYRYDGTTGDLIDGALFVFVVGTDPEAFLMLEDREIEGKPTWHYGLVRMTSSALTVDHGGRQVWNAPVIPWAQVANHKEPYTAFSFRNEEGAATP